MTRQQPTPGGYRRKAVRAVDNYLALRRSGYSAARARSVLNLSDTVSHTYEEHYRIEVNGGKNRDSSCPKFARHTEHVGAVMARGGFTVLPIRVRA